MPEIFPFPAIRPVKNKVCLVPTKDYESIPRIEVNRILKTNPFSYLNIIAGNYLQSLPANRRYTAIKKRFNRFKKKKILIQDSMPFFYVLRITYPEGYSFTGIVGLALLEDYLNGKIKKHEKTLEKRVKVFSDYLKNVRIQSDPVLLTYDKHPLINGYIQTVTHQIPEYEFSTVEGVIYEMWPVSEFSIIQEISYAFKEVPEFYIADGHHRMESTARMQQALMQNNPHHSGLESYNFVLSYFLPYQDLKIYSFNRGLKYLNGLTVKEFIKKLEEKFPLEKINKFMDPEPHTIIISTKDYSYKLNIPETYLKENLTDVEFLNEQIFKGIIGIEDIRKDDRISYCEGKLHNKCLTRKIKKNECSVGFFLHPLRFEDIMKKANAGLTLPPKSTYIEPKFLTGLMIYEF